MQEVTIRQRSVFTHSVTIDSPGKELCWNFFTRKKNISFGLFRKEDARSRKMTMVTGSTGDIMTIPPNSNIKTTDPIPRITSASSVASAEQTGTSTSAMTTVKKGRESRVQVDPPDTIPILPLAHYESSKMTIKGSYFVQEPGTFILVFDNSTSVKTSKKLFFFVALRDVEPREIVMRKVLEGWVLKKGNRSMQGYQRRWVEVQSSGIMTYYKGPGRSSHGSINLISSAIRLDHDYLLIDIDSEQTTYHFKAENRDEFERWTSVFEQFNSQKTALNFGIIMEGEEPAYNSSSASLPEQEHTQAKLSVLITTLQNELTRVKELTDNSKAKMERKELQALLNAVADASQSAGKVANEVQEEFKKYQVLAQQQRDRQASIIQALEAAFYGSLNDGNRVRKKFGLEIVHANKYLPNSEVSESTSIFSRQDEEFFDAEEGSDFSDDDYSLHDAVENFTVLDEDSDNASRSSSVNLLVSDSTQAKLPVPALPVKEEKVSRPIIRRTTLPAPAASMENISIMGILRNNVGKDLSTVAMPIALNEPINLLQKLCEELEYCQLLQEAALKTDPVERLALVAAFVVSGYSSSIHRAARKPFNPLLGETFEFDRPDKGFRYISEKVSHHPPIMACHASSSDYEFYQDSLLKTKFWGKSMELNNVGIVNVRFPKLNEHYVYQKMTTSMRNMFSSSRYLEYHGTIKITSKNTGHYCELTFKESGYFASSNNEVTGAVYSPEGKKMVSIGGRWDQSVHKFQESNPNQLVVLWRSTPFPANHADNYSFTQFAIELNELTPDLEDLLPSTDTRYRTDQRLYEQGRVQEAEQEKLRLEQKQRDSRKDMETKGEKWTPRFFQLAPNSDSETGQSWVYKGEYWENRGRFQNEPDLFS